MEKKEEEWRSKMRNLRILFISDEPVKALWDHFDRSRLEGIDLIISCGDLPPQYLSFLATFFHGPVLYVHGNHDTSYLKTPPGGCICIDDKVYVYKGIRIAGLGGCMEYMGGPFQFTEWEMWKRAFKLRRRIFFKRGIDIFVTHAPAFGLNDAEDLPHRGFKCFYKILEKYHPKYFVHGHMHFSYNYSQKREAEYQDVKVINAYERYILEYPMQIEEETW